MRFGCLILLMMMTDGQPTRKLNFWKVLAEFIRSHLKNTLSSRTAFRDLGICAERLGCRNKSGMTFILKCIFEMASRSILVPWFNRAPK